MIKGIIKLAVFVAVIYGFYYWYSLPLIYVDAENGCNIIIEQSSTYKKPKVREAIEFVKLNSPEYYKKMCDYVGVVNSGTECFNSSEGRVLACAHGGNKIGFKPLSDSSIDNLASILVHETCHFHQGHTATPESYQNPNLISEREAECYREQDIFLKKLKSKSTQK